MKVTAFYRILLLLLFLGFGKAVMAVTGHPQEIDLISDYVPDTDNHKNYGDVPANSHILFHKRTSELPSNSELRTFPGLLPHNRDKDLYLPDGQSFFPIAYDGYFTVGLDSLTIIYPFHTFL